MLMLFPLLRRLLQRPPEQDTTPLTTSISTSTLTSTPAHPSLHRPVLPLSPPLTPPLTAEETIILTKSTSYDVPNTYLTPDALALPERQCTLCLEPRGTGEGSGGTVAVTECGHVFCWGCLGGLEKVCERSSVSVRKLGDSADRAARVPAVSPSPAHGKARGGVQSVERLGRRTRVCGGGYMEQYTQHCAYPVVWLAKLNKARYDDRSICLAAERCMHASDGVVTSLKTIWCRNNCACEMALSMGWTRLLFQFSLRSPGPPCNPPVCLVAFDFTKHQSLP
jgi:hypothetical protein